MCGKGGTGGESERLMCFCCHFAYLIELLLLRAEEYWMSCCELVPQNNYVIHNQPLNRFCHKRWGVGAF